MEVFPTSNQSGIDYLFKAEETCAMSTAHLIDAVPMPLLRIASDYRITEQNSAATDMFGRDVTGTSSVALLRQAAVLAAIDAAIRDGQPGEARFLLAGQSGEVAYHFRVKSLPDGGALLSFEDSTRQDEESTIRRAFVANISHELRTPLTSLIGFIETLRGPAKDDPDARDRFLSIMEDEAGRMSRMVSDLLSLSRVEVDERVRPRDQIEIAGVVRSVIATLEGKLKAAKVTVETHGLEQSGKIKGDRDQLIQLFLNILENAIKYGKEGQTISIHLHEVEHDTTLRERAIQVDIQDQGAGIEPIHLPRLTERFYRIDDHRSRQKGGTGLGLAIVKHIINRHRGRLKITSEQGVGSCFSVIFPCDR